MEKYASYKLIKFFIVCTPLILTMIFFTNLGCKTTKSGKSINSTNTIKHDSSNVTFESIGILKRKRNDCDQGLKDFSKFKEKQVAAFSICINQAGEIIYIAYNSKESKTNDPKFVKAAYNYQKSCIYEADSNAFKKECGTVYIRFDGVKSNVKIN